MRFDFELPPRVADRVRAYRDSTKARTLNAAARALLERGLEAWEARTASAPQSVEDFARTVKAAARTVDGQGRYGGQVFIAALHERMGAHAGTLDEFKQRLLEAQRLGALQLARADLVEVMPREMVKQSEVSVPLSGRLAATFHFLEDR